MVIGLVLSEIWIFEVNLKILSLGLSRLEYEGYNLPYTTSNKMQQIFLES